MATRGVEPITLPWKRPEKGVSAAELGASFRVEQREDGWHCTVRVGRRAEVLATGLRRLRDAQCRAEAHAATMPEVLAAKAKAESEGANPAAKERKDPARRTAPGPTSEPVPAAEKPSRVPVRRRAVAPTFEEVSDGCICGKIDTGTWIADPAGKVSVPAGTDPALAQEICRVAANHYAGQRQKAAPAVRPRTAARSASKPREKREAEAADSGKSGNTRKPAVADAAPVDPPRRAGKGKRNRKKARQRLAAKLAAKPGRRGAAAKTADPESKPTAKATAKTAAKVAAKTTAKVAAKTTAKVAAKTTAKAVSKTKTTAKATATKATAKNAATEATAKNAATKATAKIAATKATAKTTPGAEAAASVTAKTAGRRRKGTEVPAVAPPKAKEEPMGKKAGKRPGKSDACSCVTWAEVEGKARGETKHGAFVIEPEGRKHALYFYDPEGQSRHLQSGDAAKLRKVAEEMAARGQPAMKPTSAGDDGALLKMFMAGAMEEET